MLRRRGIHPVVATILLIAIAIAAVAIVGIWYVSFQSRMQEETERKTAEGEEARQKGSIKIEKISATSSELTVYVRNTGTIEVTVDKVFVTDKNGKVIVVDWGATLSPGSLKGTSFNVGGLSTGAGDTLTVKVVTKEGASAEAAVTIPL